MRQVFDSNMQVLAADCSGLRFFSADAPEVRLDGFPWRRPGGAFNRLPAPTAERPFTEILLRLAECAAGGQLAFRTDSKRIVVRAKIGAAHRMARMALTGAMGFDAYVEIGGKKQFRNETAFNLDVDEYCVEACSFGNRRLREITLNFPLFARVDALEIGIEEDACLSAPAPWADARPVVVYGTSLVHGACASRPGNCYPNALSRRLGRPVYNFGFSGNARGEAFMAQTLAEIPDPALYVVDYDANTNTKDLEKTLGEFIRILRAARPETPVLTVSRIPHAFDMAELPEDGSGIFSDYDWSVGSFADVHRETVRKIRQDGDKQVHFLDGRTLLGADFPDFIADGIHLNDAGLLRMAEMMEPVIRRLIPARAGN